MLLGSSCKSDPTLEISDPSENSVVFLTEVVFAELGLPKGTTLDSLKLTGPVAEGVALNKKAIEAKIKSKVDARMLIYKKNLDKGLIFNTRPSSSTPGQILTSEQFIRQLPNRLSAVTPKGAN